MKSRILVAVVGVPLLFALLFFAPTVALAIFIALISAIGVYEITEPVKNRLGILSRCAAMLTAAALPIWIYTGSCTEARFIWAFALMIVLSVDAMFINKKNTGYEAIASAALAGMFIPFFLTSILNIRMMDQGKYLVFMPFISAFISDAGAYFTGRACGKRKLAPSISPNKTVEGSVGGCISSVVFMGIYALILKYAVHMDVSIALFALFGLLGSAAGQIGDLAFSYVKRKFGIKDYGNLLPGHGGVLDRFDSMIFVAPLTELMLVCLPLVK